MRNRQGLAELSAASAFSYLFRSNSICIDVKAPEIVAHQQQCALTGRSNIQVRSGTPVKAAEIADCDGGPGVMTWYQNALQSCSYASCIEPPVALFPATH